MRNIFMLLLFIVALASTGCDDCNGHYNNHGYSRWSDEVNTNYVGMGDYIIWQSRTCTNCGEIEMRTIGVIHRP